MTINPYGLAKDFVQDTNKEGVVGATENLVASAADQLPYSSIFSGGRIPIGSTADKFGKVGETVLAGLKTGEWDTDTLGQTALMAALSITPGGGQARKTILGVQSLQEGGYYTNTGKLRYPITKDDAARALIFGPSAVAPEGYDWTKYFSDPKTEMFEKLSDKGYDPMSIYDAMLGMGTTNAEKSLSILTTDSDNDGKPDFTGKDIDVIAAVLGLSYDPKTDGSLQKWAQQEAATYKKNAAKDGITADEQAKIERIDTMLAILLG